MITEIPETKYYIYSLHDPETREVKYIGKTSSPDERLQQHIYESRYTVSEKDLWIKNIINRGLSPVIKIIDIANSFNCDEIERFYIKKAIKMGCILLNKKVPFPDGSLVCQPVGFPSSVWNEINEYCKINDTHRGNFLETAVYSYLKLQKK